MTDKARLREIVENVRLSPEQVAVTVRQIQESILAESRWLDGPNFTSFHPDDLESLFEAYDSLFFDGLCRKLVGKDRLSFRISSRMTRVGGKTTRFRDRRRPDAAVYEIALSSTLLFETFYDVERSVTVTGLECVNRLEALQRILEHELIHLIELVLWDHSLCSAHRFQSMASRFFGHTDHRHQLVTVNERALKKLGIRTGSRVRFRFDGTEHVGTVNRITKRATVLVEDGRGQRYSDGKRYAKFYIPVEMLEPTE